MWKTSRFIQEISEKEKKCVFYKTWTDQKSLKPTRSQSELTINRPRTHQELIWTTWFWLIPGGFLVNSWKMIRLNCLCSSHFIKRKTTRTDPEHTRYSPGLRDSGQFLTGTWSVLVVSRFITYKKIDVNVNKLVIQTM